MNSILERKLPSELIIDNEVFQELRKRNDLKIFFQSLLNIGSYILVGLFGIWLNIWWIWPLLWICQGFLLSCFFDAAHECIHNNFSGSARLNRLAGTLWLLPLFVNFSQFKHYHLEHHKHTKLSNDPEPSETFISISQYLLYFLIVVFVAHIKTSIEMALGRIPNYVRSDKLRRDINFNTLALLLWLICIITCTVLFWQYTTLLYWCPLLFVYPIGLFTVTLEHYGCDESSCILSNTRSISSNFLFRCLVWNGNYHAEHHAYPSVPAHNLPRLHTLIGKHFKYQERSYVMFHFKLIRSLLQKSGN
ncbi:hypothetical protein NIES2101_13190 [Calothrix sp. HK-06]|nr:hypothetical protein NIES2101_13190 [Calothrix sp. HK-06]